MKSVRVLLCGAALLGAAATAQAAIPADGGGRDVSVVLFSTRDLRSLTLTPMGPGAWVATCERCAHRKLSEPLHVNGHVDVFAGGMLRVTDDKSGDMQTAAGLWHVRASTSNYTLQVVLTLPSERYVAAVLSAEADAKEPAQSLQALAIVARTYALNGIHFVPRPGQLQADLCDSTECEAMRLGPVPASIEQAVQATAGETLWFGPHRAEVYFSQSCGGVTEDAGAVWPTLRGVPYLESHPDPYCLRRDHAAWHAEISLKELAGIARAEGWRILAQIVAAHVGERSVSHRAESIVLIDDKGNRASISASALRFGVGRALGWNRLRSESYDLGLRNGRLIFDGHGHGHGVGLCQLGSTEMATEGKGTRAILAFYFPGTVVRITPHDEGWHETHVGSITLRTSAHSSPGEASAMIKSSWSEALRRFPPHREVAPRIILAPSTELFRQMTSQPGWAAASTRGDTIVLQPEAALLPHNLHPATVLLHEMLHVLVEAEATQRAPLWLREGLVEVLAGEGDASAPKLSAAETERGLNSASTWAESERVHRAAAARVRSLVARYGMSTVRGWLSSGPPDDAM